MAKSSKLRVMISRRCNDLLKPGVETGKKLSDIRRDLKEEIETATIFGKQAFDVWINEDAPPAPGTEDSWEYCKLIIVASMSPS